MNFSKNHHTVKYGGFLLVVRHNYGKIAHGYRKRRCRRSLYCKYSLLSRHTSGQTATPKDILPLTECLLHFGFVLLDEYLPHPPSSHTECACLSLKWKKAKNYLTTVNLYSILVLEVKTHGKYNTYKTSTTNIQVYFI